MDGRERPPPGDFCLGNSHQNRFAPKGSPAHSAGFTRHLPVPRPAGDIRICRANRLSCRFVSRLGRPPEVRIRAILRPDAHAQHPCCAPSGSTSALPRRSLAYGAGTPTELSNSVKPRTLCLGPVWRVRAAQAFWPGNPKDGGREYAGRTPAQGCAVGRLPRQRRVREKGVAPSGRPSLW